MTDAALFRGRYIINTSVPNASGIRKGDPVQMHGVNIGRILGFTSSSRASTCGSRSRASTRSARTRASRSRRAGCFGGMVADVIPGTSAQKVTWGDPLPGGTGVGLFDKMDALAGEADKVAKRVQGLLSDDMVKDLQGSACGDARSRSRACRRS